MYDLERGCQHPSIDVLVTGRSGTSKSILINGIFGREVVKERHGVVNVARSSSVEFYTSNIDGVQINVWVSSQLQDGSVTDEVNYLRDLKAQCSKVDLVLYCLKMTETRFTPGNPDDQAITKITQTLGHRVWNKTIFVLTYANVAAEVNCSASALNSNKTLEAAFKESIVQWREVLEQTLSNAAGIPQSKFNIKVVPAGHYKQPHLPDRHYWLSVLWTECHDLLTLGRTRDAFHQINKARFRKESEVEGKFSQYTSTNQPLVRLRETKWTVKRTVVCGGVVFFCVGLLIGLLTGDIALIFILPILCLGLGCVGTYMLHFMKYT